MTPDSDLERLAQELGLPLMVKPPHEGSTLGVTRVDELAGLRKAYELAALYDDEVLAEKFIEGPELTVPFLGKGTTARVLTVSGNVAPGGTYNHKQQNIHSENYIERKKEEI